MTNAKVLVVALVVAGCGDDGTQGTPDGGGDAFIARGNVTVYTHPGARVDFMSAATDQVITSVVADAAGKAEAEIDNGDRAVIVGANQVRILDALEPTKEYRYRWYVDGLYAFQPKTSVTATWTAPANATAYRVASLCGGTTGYLTAATVTTSICNAGDGLLVTAFDSNYDVISSAYQVVAAPPGGPLAISAPFQPHRNVALTLARSAGSTIGDLSTTLITAEGARLMDEPFVSSSTPTITAVLPAVDGDVRTYAVVGVPTLGARWLIDRRPVADAITLDLDAVDVPYVQSLATKDAASSSVTWTQAGTGTPTLVVITWNGPNEASYTLMTRYTGTSAVLPVLPPDVTPVAMPTAGGSATLVASPDGYEAAIEALGRQNDPLMSGYSLYFSTYF